MIDERLEKLSDKVRMGYAISASEAFEVMEYQSNKLRKLSLWNKIKKWFKREMK